MSVSSNSQKRKKIEVVAAALFDKADQKYLLARRSPGGPGAGEWEFPGGKIEAGESQLEALVREIDEELGVALDPNLAEFLAGRMHAYPERDIMIYLWRYPVIAKPKLRLMDHDQSGWFTVAEILKLGISVGDQPFISLLE